ncbi:hypothetical protein IAG44_37185 [Streptomyces roseirectus]|uniref:Uncharacterized protein n=1 Tax=Streptomyces roseirectus TaxID=2768066 RepID=A0A7H0ITX0_9ACTN|nr:hypothetical protein [Streptomyces roseirectus]QNP76236.1 hypothetical protein IAG44_37185 [Streptomyces roseirectus]
MSQCVVGRWAFGTPAHRAEGRVMTVSRVPGLVLPVIFLVALLAGLVWYWRESRGERRRGGRQRRREGD